VKSIFAASSHAFAKNSVVNQCANDQIGGPVR